MTLPDSTSGPLADGFKGVRSRSGTVDALPYPPRPGQRELVAVLERAVRRGGHAVVESGTGTGKTVSALAAALPAAQDLGKRVLYLTRTNAQERQVVVEFRQVAPRLARPATAVALQGRTHLCPLRAEDPAMADATSEELALMCRDRVKAAEDERNGKRARFAGCRFYAATEGEALAGFVGEARASALTAEELVGRAVERRMCPYYVSRALLADATLVVAPYVYWFNPFLRRALLEWMGAVPRDLVVVVDEAHNLPDYARESLSKHLGRHGLERASREVEEFGDRELPGTGLTVAAFLARLNGVVEGLAAEHLLGEDGLVPPDAFDAELLSALRSTTRTWDRVAAALLGFGEEVREARRRAGRVPRSYVGSVGTFLVDYRESEPESFLRLVEEDRTSAGPRLALACLDATLATSALLDAHATLHVSGTLAPLEAYRDAIGLPEDTELAEFPSPFARDRRAVLVDTTVTTRHADVAADPEAWTRLGRRLAEVRAAASGRNAAVFAPSFDVLARLEKHLPRGTLVEDRGADQRTLMALVDEFKGDRGATLLAVTGGRLGEGLDFPGGELELVVIAGLPYPKPTARLTGLVRFFDARFGRGFEYAVVVPTVRRTLQAVGRLIRSPDDRGVVVLLDRRAVTLKPYLPELVSGDDPAHATQAFFARGEGLPRMPKTT